MTRQSYKRYYFPIIAFLTIITFFHAEKATALEPDFYTSSSALSEGKWAKIEVTETGMQFLSNATLKNLGFSNPSEVNIYGYGGVMLPERLDAYMKDDLPLVPSIVTSTGILFFGESSTGWKQNLNGISEYSHINNPYSDRSFYFISNIAGENIGVKTLEALSAENDDLITVFTERVAYENDIIAPSNTGRLMLGEDFRGTPNRFFQFDLPGNIGDALATIKFGAKAGGGAALMFTANGESLESVKEDQIGAASSSKFINTTTTIKEISDPGEKLNLGINFTYSGALSLAALDYIEIEYPRSLSLKDGELHFYINPESNSNVKIEGCSESTIVWDVTDRNKIREIPTQIKNGQLTFVSQSGYHEYVAFNPASIKRAVKGAGAIKNQNIHAEEAPGMAIITPEAYKSAAQRIAALHAKTDRLSVLIVTPEEVYNEFSSGNPDVTAFRKMLKMWYDRAQGNEENYTKYCLIMSRPTYDTKMVTAVVKNAGYPRVPIWQSPTGDSESTSYSTDDYIGMLADNSSDLSMGNATIHVAVARMPVKSAEEAATAVTKLENYILNPNYGAWRNNVMIIADDQDNGVHLTQAEACHDAMRNSGNGADYLYEKLYLDSYPMVYTGTGASYPDAKQRMMDKINEGVLFIDYIGHANPSAWGHEGLLNWTDITSFKNKNLPFLLAATCEFMRWDDDAVSGAEEMWLNPDAGVIGMICPSRSVLITANGILNKATSQFIFAKDKDGNNLTVGDIMVKGKNSGQTDTNKLRYGLMGDPSMRLPSPEYTSHIVSIGDEVIEASEDYPEIQASASVTISGEIKDKDGNDASNFNGTLNLMLYDAEKVITTYGNGPEGVESMYNDRKTRLYTGKVKVERGKWNTTVTMPAEIENNYSPALISMYASTPDGREANGAFENFYVYGYDKSGAKDFEGPEILAFYLNNPSFSSGDAVSPSPILVARFRDESGINTSEGGIGHSMIMTLDGKEFFTDVIRYYSPDEADPLIGEIVYPLSNLSGGEHSLALTVWDNANNSTTANLVFNVSATWTPSISTLTTDVNPATTGVNFIVETDGVSGATKCMVEVFDLMGRKIWTSASSDMPTDGNIRLGWNLCDGNGSRVPRGIYLYRATITCSNGATVTKSKKLAVSS